MIENNPKTAKEVAQLMFDGFNRALNSRNKTFRDIYEYTASIKDNSFWCFVICHDDTELVNQYSWKEEDNINPDMLIDEFHLLMDKSLIPKGQYCYDEQGKCPYWSKNTDKPHQESGYCSFLQKGDWESNQLSLLWDQVKECGINDELEDEE